MVTMTNLHVEDEDFYFDGDLRLLGETVIDGGNLTVTGELILAETSCGECSFEVINGDVTAKNIFTENSNGIIADVNDKFCHYFRIADGDIHITDGSLDLGNCDIYEVCDIYVDVGDLICGRVLDSYSIYVNDTITSLYITTRFDLCCYNGDFSGDIDCGRDMYVEDQCDMNNSNLFVGGVFQAGSLINVEAIKVGS